MSFRLLRTVLAVGLILGSSLANAEQKLSLGAHSVHYTLLNSIDLQPEIARQYGVRRSRERGVVVLGIRDASNGTEKAGKATATGVAYNLIGHRQNLDWSVVDEGDAYYLISSFEISHLEFLNFEIQVLPDGVDTPMYLKLSRQFFTD